MRNHAWAIALVAVAFCVSCGGGRAADEPRPFVPFVPEGYALVEVPFVAPVGDTVDESALAIVDARVEAGRDAQAQPFVGDLLVVEVESPDELVFVHHGPWPPGVVSAILRDFYSVRVGDAASMVQIASTDEIPFALDYLYGEGWWGPLEAALYQAFADPALDRSDPEPFVLVATEVLDSFGVSLRGNRVDVLDALLRELPRPPDLTTTYQPVATLVAIGLILGDHLVDRHAALTWIDGRAIMARYFGITAEDRGVLRPIDYVMQAYHGPSGQTVRGYAAMVGVYASEE